MEILRLEAAVFVVQVATMLLPWSGVVAGACALIALNALHADNITLAEIAGVATFIAVCSLPFGVFLPTLTQALTQDYAIRLPLWRFLAWLLLCATGVGLAWWYYRHGVAILDALRVRFTKATRQARDTRTDIRTVAETFPALPDYDPRAYYREGVFFLGLNEKQEPVYWTGRLPHVSVSGFSGAGKGKKLQSLACQSITNDELLIYLDPKDDEWGAYVIYDACLRQEKPYYYLHLSPKQPPQFNLLEGATDFEIEELFSASFNLLDKGGEADFYRVNDRAAAFEAAQLAATKHLTLAELWQEVGELFAKRAPGFVGKLHELARLPAANAKAGGVSLSSMLATGGAVYVVGSTTVQSVRRAQQMLFVRLLQLATARNRTEAPLKTVCIIADEAKYHISRPVLNGLGTARDKGVRIVVAFQSFADLRDVPSDLDADAVIGSFTENTPCKLVYRLEDPETAEWYAQKSGNKLVDDELRTVDKNLLLTETLEGSGRTLRQMEAYHIDLNQLLSLPAGWAVAYGDGVAKCLKIGTLRVEKAALAVQVHAAQALAVPVPPSPVSLAELIAPDPTLAPEPRPASPSFPEGVATPNMSNTSSTPKEQARVAQPKRAAKPKTGKAKAPSTTSTAKNPTPEPNLQDLI